MPTDEKTENQCETAERSEPVLKHRFKLDKKHVQGFIAGILAAVIAFTGLYYITGGSFFKGEMIDYCVYVSDANFEEEVINSDIPVLVVFWAEWSGISRQVRKLAKEYAPNYSGSVKFVMVDVDAVPGATQQNRINSVPTCIIFKDGISVGRLVGYINSKQLANFLEKNR